MQYALRPYALMQYALMQYALMQYALMRHALMQPPLCRVTKMTLFPSPPFEEDDKTIFFNKG